MTDEAVRPWTLESVLANLRSTAYWRDQWIVVFLGLAFVVNVAAFCHVVMQYPNLPEFLPLHYNAQGDVDYIGTRVESFKIPAIGTLIWVANALLGLLLHRMEPLASRLLVVAAVVTQLLLLAAVVTIVR